MLTIIALMVGMTVSAGITQLDIAKIQGTKQSLEVVRQALNLFQKKYGRYPCPADPTLATSHANYGVEYNSGSCAVSCPMGGLSCGTNAVIGMVPFKSIGLNEGISYDAWDRRITYAVDKNHTTTSEYENGTLSVQDGSGNEITASPVLGKAIFVLASHGEDGNGGYTKTAQLAKACGATAKDIENCDYNDDIFAAAPFNNGDVAASFSDDLIAWQTQENVNEEPEEEEGPTPGIPSMRTWSHSCAIKADTTVWCWGLNNYGQLGNNSTTNSNVPVQVQKITDGTALTGVTQLAYMGEATCALINDGTVYCWGQNGQKEVGDGTTAQRHRAKLVAGVSDVGSLGTWTIGIFAFKTDGTAVDWGSGNNPGDNWGAGITNAVQGQDGNHLCYVKTDGTVWCGGGNGSGQLGDGTTTDHWPPEQVAGLTDVVQVAQGETTATTTCALKGDGTVWCWGENSKGEVGDNGKPTDRKVPTNTGLSNVVLISSGTDNGGNGGYFCAVKDNGSLWCWGGNSSGPRLLGQAASFLAVPTEMTGISNVESIISMGDNFMCIKKPDDTLWCWGFGDEGQLGNGGWAQQNVAVQVQNFP